MADIAVLNAHDETVLAATLHFPRYSLSGGRLRTWSGPEDYLSDFRSLWIIAEIDGVWAAQLRSSFAP